MSPIQFGHVVLGMEMDALEPLFAAPGNEHFEQTRGYTLMADRLSDGHPSDPGDMRGLGMGEGTACSDGRFTLPGEDMDCPGVDRVPFVFEGYPLLVDEDLTADLVDLIKVGCGFRDFDDDFFSHLPHTPRLLGIMNEHSSTGNDIFAKQ